MIELNDDNDPMLFACNVPAGRLVVQYMEVAAAVQANSQPNTEPQMRDFLIAMRQAARTKDIAAATPDEMLIAMWFRMTKALEASGKI